MEQKISRLFKTLGAPEALSGQAQQDDAASFGLRVNAHIHLPPNFSAFDTVSQAVQLAAEQEVGVLGVSNYYDYSVYAEFADLASKRGIFPLFGLEIITLNEALVQSGVKVNDPGNPGKMYICGKGITRFDPMNAQAATLLEVIRSKDSERMARMTDRLAGLFAAAGLQTGLDAKAVRQRIVGRHGSPLSTVFLQERHVAQAFQEVVFEKVPAEQRGALWERLFGVPSRAEAEDTASVQSEIRSHLMKAGKAAYVEETFVDFDHAYRLILALGGIPCYPTLADGAAPICSFETPVERLIVEIKARGIPCAEFIPVRNTPEVLSTYVKAMRSAGITVTAGTEHNTRDMLPIEPTCLDGQPIPEDIRAIFWEGACVVAAHQYLMFQGREGYVDGQGRLNPQYATNEERIAAYRSLGEAVLRKYGQSVLRH